MIVNVRLYPPSEADYGVIAEYLTARNRSGPTVIPSQVVRFALMATARMIARVEDKRGKRTTGAATARRTTADDDGDSDTPMLTNPVDRHPADAVPDKP